MEEGFNPQSLGFSMAEQSVGTELYQANVDYQKAVTDHMRSQTAAAEAFKRAQQVRASGIRLTFALFFFFSLPLYFLCMAYLYQQVF